MRIGLAQVRVVDGDKRGNLDIARTAIDEAADKGADLVVFPEMHLTGFPARAELQRLTETRTGPAIAALLEHAAGRGIGLVASFAECAAGSDDIFNTSVIADRAGRPLGYYRKTHLFDVERAVITPGDALGDVVTFEGVRMGLLICYDIEFPETARRLALAGAQCIVVPTGNMTPYGHRHRVFITARALENHVYVAYCNRCGTGAGFEFPGESALVDPCGRLVCEADAHETVICGDLDVETIGRSRSTSDYLAERRPEVYGTLRSRP